MASNKWQEEELQVVKDQDPDGTEETNFIEETSITVDDVSQNKKNKKQQNFVAISDATLPSSQVLCSAYSQGNETLNNKKNKMTSSQKQNQQVHYAQIQQFQQPSTQQMKQLPSIGFNQDIQQQQIKQQMQQAAQQRKIEQIKQQYPNLTAAEIRQLQQLQAQQQLQTNLNNFNNNNSNNISINVSNNKTPTTNNNNSSINSQQQPISAATAIEIIPTTVETIPATAIEINIEPENTSTKVQQPNEQKVIDAISAEIEKEILLEVVQTLQSTTNQQLPLPQINQTPIVSVISDEDIIKELNLNIKLPYRRRKIGE